MAQRHGLGIAGKPVKVDGGTTVATAIQQTPVVLRAHRDKGQPPTPPEIGVRILS
jgi:hypothetical protein